MTGDRLTRTLPIWALRVAWLALPLAAAPAVNAAVRGWSDPVRIASEALLWLAWAIGLLSVLTPRPPTLTALRTIAPAFVAVAVVVAIDGAASTVACTAAVLVTAIAAVLAAGPDMSLAAANSLAYGNELRVPLRVPPALFLGPLPLARALVVASVAAPVLLLAARAYVWGVLTLLLALGLLRVLVPALHRLSRRWAVLVPAGFVVVDPMTLADPVLFVRQHIHSVVPIGVTPTEGDVIDLRLGATRGSLVVRFDELAEITRAPRGRSPAQTVRTPGLAIAAVRRDGFLLAAADNRLPTR